MFKLKKAVSNTTILSIVMLIVIVIILLILTINFSKKVEKTDETSSSKTCKLPGTMNRCCLPSEDSVIPANVGSWQDCQEPDIACCVG